MSKNLKRKEISLVIGSISQHLNEIIILLNNLGDNIYYLKEIICVVSGIDSDSKMKSLSSLEDIVNIKIEIIPIKKIIMPGEARNIGIIESKSDYVCFLDSRTLPGNNWLSSSIKILDEKKIRGTLGRTKYVPLDEFEKCFIAATYGNKPLFTLPGTLIEKSLLKEIGFFIPDSRCGEDSEWINRSLSFEKNIKQFEVVSSKYVGFKGMKFLDLCKKWYRNYQSTYLIPKLQIQRIIYLGSFFISLIFLTFSWNDKIANWDENSFLYVPHISKIMILLIFLTYSIFRFIVLPFKKNKSFFRFNFSEFIITSFIAIILDIVKFIALITYKSKGIKR